MEKRCYKCNLVKPLEEFHKNSSKPDGRQNICKVCRIVYHRKHYLKNKDSYIESKNKRLNFLKEFVFKIKRKNQCSKCSEKRWYVLDFHHLKNKDKSISDLISAGVSLKLLKKEIRKCIILCANCHREYHYFENKHSVA